MFFRLGQNRSFPRRPTSRKGVSPGQQTRTRDAAAADWARLRVAQLRCSSVGIRQHRSDLLRQGESPEKIEELADWQGCWLFSERERLVLALAEAMTLRPDAPACGVLLQCARRSFLWHDFVEILAAIESVNEWNDLALDHTD